MKTSQTSNTAEIRAAKPESFQTLAVEISNGIIVSAHPLIEVLLGFPEGTLEGRNLDDLNPRPNISSTDLIRFTAAAAHDLVSPLNQAAALASLFTKRYSSRLDADADEILTHLQNAAQRMTQLVGGLGNYLHAFTTVHDLRPIDANAALTAALDCLKESLEATVAVVSAGHLPEVRGNSNGLASVFTNLIDNAIKFRKPSVPPAIQVAACRSGRTWQFSVRDNGIGVSAEQIQRIFLPFARIHGHEYPGSGLGLSTSKIIVEAAGGEIWMESEAGQGSAVHFTLQDGASAFGAGPDRPD
ncbi:MAG TPA: ATP-binding protein [Bryobacteraceae bacterium]|nr:ATP-binding protein [Bryobacteraceae bacterium]